MGSTPTLSAARSATTSTTVSSARSGAGRSMKKKSRSWSGPGSRWGGRPWLSSWAAVVRLRRRAAGDQVLERLAGANRRQLVGVADEDDVGGLGEPFEQHLGEAQVQHRGLVDDHQIDRQRPAGAEAG